MLLCLERRRHVRTTKILPFPAPTAECITNPLRLLKRCLGCLFGLQEIRNVAVQKLFLQNFGLNVAGTANLSQALQELSHLMREMEGD